MKTEPFVFSVLNDSEIEGNAILFGYHNFKEIENFGSSNNIKIIPDKGVEYKDCLKNRFVFQKFTIKSNNTRFLDNGEMRVIYLEGHGHRRYEDVVSFSQFKNTFQDDFSFIDIDVREIKITEDSYLNIKVPAKTQFTIIIYPSIVEN